MNKAANKTMNKATDPARNKAANMPLNLDTSTTANKAVNTGANMAVNTLEPLKIFFACNFLNNGSILIHLLHVESSQSPLYSQGKIFLHHCVLVAIFI